MFSFLSRSLLKLHKKDFSFTSFIIEVMLEGTFSRLIAEAFTKHYFFLSSAKIWMSRKCLVNWHLYIDFLIFFKVLHFPSLEENWDSSLSSDLILKVVNEA